jgi:hypothetical protein
MFRGWVEGQFRPDDSVLFFVYFRQYIEKKQSKNYLLLQFLASWILHSEINRSPAHEFVERREGLFLTEEGQKDLDTTWFWTEFDKEIIDFIEKELRYKVS